ncbi:hypothetical protein GUJ93_ZPchr0013g36892 [Zizania palustris]|uniref:Uncharacterized protein n=1 Tax=Zizania palustris TaxID=103762 RepID=A0A8J6BZ27_ZIZPA|nr:hypothetical protein GUJ93_ZPchr0013g36892 [Zizania palustris]
MGKSDRARSYPSASKQPVRHLRLSAFTSAATEREERRDLGRSGRRRRSEVAAVGEAHRGGAEAGGDRAARRWRRGGAEVATGLGRIRDRDVHMRGPRGDKEK